MIDYKKLRPTIIKVNGKPYLINFAEKSPLIEFANHGYCDNVKQVIHIEGDQTPFEECDTVIHELLHAVWSQMSLTGIEDDVEERIVAALGTGITGLFSSNPSLLDYYKCCLGEVNNEAKQRKSKGKNPTAGRKGLNTRKVRTGA